MNMTLICPGDASEVPALARKRPLVLAPFLGRTVLEHALTALAESGMKNIRILASDHPEDLRSLVGRGEAWGMTVEVVPSSPRTCDGHNPASSAEPILILDHLAQLPQLPLWQSYRGWYAAQQALLPALARRRVGMREIALGSFVGLRSQVAPNARLLGPCWIGEGVWIGSQAVIGPGTVIEDGSYIDEGAEIAGSIVGPRTYLGAFTELRDSFAWGSDLLHLDTGSLTEVGDRFLLGEVQTQRGLLGCLVQAVRGICAAASSPQRGPGPASLSGAGVRLEPMPQN